VAGVSATTDERDTGGRVRDAWSAQSQQRDPASSASQQQRPASTPSPELGPNKGRDQRGRGFRQVHAHESGLDLHANPGYRTEAQQAVLYERFRHGQSALAAAPGAQ
jgi:hypothetical protein